MTKQRMIAVVTGTRAEFGLLAPVLRAITVQRRLRLRLVVTGAHLTSGTWRDIAAAGFRIDSRVPMQRRGVTGRAADVAALGRGIAGLGKVFADMQPDVVLVLGDRIEAFAAASAASIGGCRVAHLHGGDRAEGVADEAMRHALSKLAHLHFPATAQSRRRLIRMGEEARWIWNVGSPAMDGLADVRAAGDAPDLIVIQHPIGAAKTDEERWMAQTLRGAAACGDLARLVLAPNGDPGAGGIRRALAQAGITPVEHLGRPRFLELLAGVKVIAGNSSAGLIEAAALGTPCVNIGPRQAGREQPANVIDCDYGAANVQAAIRKALALGHRKFRHPYGDGHAGRRIAEILATINLEDVPLRKRNAY